MRAKQKVRANFETRRFERKMWVYIAAHELHIPTWIKLPIVTALIKNKDDALQQCAAQGLLSLFTKGVCLLRQAAQYLLSAVYDTRRGLAAFGSRMVRSVWISATSASISPSRSGA